jgi:CRISPR-associated endonuclease/helicase Cas3
VFKRKSVCLNIAVKFFAHTGSPDWQLLADHLREVARRARLHGAPLGLGDEAELAGLLHDLGKYAQRFQQRLKSPAAVSGVNHWAAGAFAASKMKHMAAA